MVARATPKPASDALHWDLSVTNDSDWAVYELEFPQTGLKKMDDGRLFYPFNECIEEDEPWSDEFDTFNFMYPHHSSNIQYFSVYEPSNTGLYVMPCLNSRLWDTGLDSFDEASQEGASKVPNGTVYEANYGNRTEDDGSLVRLAVMDPSTDVWQNKLREVSVRLFDNNGVDGVYFDQLGNSPSIFLLFELNDDYSRNTLRDFRDPTALCYYPDHDRPLSAGNW